MKTEIQLDVRGLSSSEELQDRILSVFELPSYYGRNWDAFWDCLSDAHPTRVTITGMAELIDVLPRDASLLVKCLSDYRSDHPIQIEIK